MNTKTVHLVRVVYIIHFLNPLILIFMTFEERSRVFLLFKFTDEKMKFKRFNSDLDMYVSPYNRSNWETEAG